MQDTVLQYFPANTYSLTLLSDPNGVQTAHDTCPLRPLCGGPSGQRPGEWEHHGHPATAQNETSYCVYILSCADDSLYTGMTNDLARRLAEHKAGRGARWTQRRLPIEVVFSLNELSYRAACDVERYIKTLSRARKEALIARNPKMLSLVEKRIVQYTPESDPT